MATTWRRDPTWSRPRHGGWLSGGSPRRLWKLGTAGRRVVDALEHDGDLPAGHEPLTRTLVAAGALHPRCASPTSPLSMSVVIPTYQPDPQRLHHLVGQIRQELGDDIPLVIVDDASPQSVSSHQGAQVVRTEVNLGPGGARNLGFEQVTTDLVVFLDDDVMLEPGWSDPLRCHFADGAVVAAAPRICGPEADQTAAWWDRREQIRSPLDLGSRPATVRPDSPVPYVPAAALMVRRDALTAVGGFDPGLRLGEDVDLIWRLAAAGGQVRYEPDAVVRHRSRATWQAWLAQRWGYGISAADLARRYPDRMVGLRATRHQLMLGLAAVLPRRQGLILACAMTAWSVHRLTRQLTRHEVDQAWLWATRWVFDSHARLLEHVAAACWRPWWPLGVLVAAGSRRARYLLTLLTLVRVLDDLRSWRTSRALDPWRNTVAARLEDLAYGAGVWQGALRRRELRVLAVTWSRPDTVHTT